MSSLRLALKLSLQENPDAASTEKQADPFDSLNAIVGRKRKGSLDKKEPRKKPRDESSSSSKPKSRSGDELNRDGSSVAGDSFTSTGLNADEASVSSHALHKDDDTHDDNDDGDDDATMASFSAVTSDALQNISDSDHLKIKEEKVSVASVKSEKSLDKSESVSESTNAANEHAVDSQLTTVSEDKQDDVTSPRKTGGKKKRLLKGLDVSEKDVVDALMEGDEDGPRYQSHRAAAMVAKTKLNVTTTTTTGKQEATDGAVSHSNIVSKEPSRRGGWNRGTGRAAAVRALQQQQQQLQQLEQEQVAIEWVLCDKCGKWRSLSPAIDIQSLPEVWQCTDNTWDLQHNHCEAPEQTEEEAKRMYSIGDGGMKSMPPSLDPPRIKREASDATSGGGSVSVGMAETPMRDLGDDADNETGGVMTSGRGGRAGGAGGGGARGRGGRGGRRGSGGAAGIASAGHGAGSDDSDDAGAGHTGVSGRSSRRQVNYAEDDDEAGGGAAGRTTAAASSTAAGQRRRGGLPSRNSGRDLNASFAAAASTVAAAVNWVECNKCKKWRKVPETIDVSKLPETWLCHMNTWNPAVARCTAKEEVDEPIAEAGGVSGGATPGRSSGRAGGGAGVGRYGGGAGNPQVQAAIASMIAANAAAIAAAANAPPLPPGVIRQIKWVQCERKNCKKWRKVPAYIDMDTFPEKWYCEMNFWSPERASCEVVEDHDSEEERKKKEARNNRNLLLGNNKGGAQLSYRRIIYGTDAKVRPHFAEKIKLGNGVFTYPIASRKANDDSDDEHVFHYNDGLEPVRRVPYWWSTAHDDRLHGLHAQCVAATFVPATATSNPPISSVSETVHESASTSDFLTLSSSAVVSQRSGEEVKPPVSYLMDTARRLYQEATNTTPLAWSSLGNEDRKAVESIEEINSLTLYQRLTVEMNVVRTLLHATNDVHVLFIRLMDLMATCQFLNPVFEACRYLLVGQKSAVVDIVHRLEEKGEVEVGYTRDNQLVVTLLPSLDTLRHELASRRSVFDHKVNASVKARHFNPRLRKCFKQSAASAVTNTLSVETLPYAESTLRAVATAVNLSVRTKDDGSLLLQFPLSGPNKIVHSSETLQPNDIPVIPPLTTEEMTMIAAAANAAGGIQHTHANVSSHNNNNNGGQGKVYMPTSTNVSAAQYQLQQQQQQQLMMMGAGGRGKRGGGGGGRGRGRGRGGAMSGEGAMERPMSGRGAKRAAKAAADAAAAAALAAGLPVPDHYLSVSSTTVGGVPLPLEGTADVVKKTRKPYTKRKTPTLEESSVPAGGVAIAPASAVSATPATPAAVLPKDIPPVSVKMETAAVSSSTSEVAIKVSVAPHSTAHSPEGVVAATPAMGKEVDSSSATKMDEDEAEQEEEEVEEEVEEEEQGSDEEEEEEEEVSVSGDEEDAGSEEEEVDEEDGEEEEKEEENDEDVSEKEAPMATDTGTEVEKDDESSSEEEEAEEQGSASEADDAEEEEEEEEEAVDRRTDSNVMDADGSSDEEPENQNETHDTILQQQDTAPSTGVVLAVQEEEEEDDSVVNEPSAARPHNEEKSDDNIGDNDIDDNLQDTEVSLHTTDTTSSDHLHDTGHIDEAPASSSEMDVDE